MASELPDNPRSIRKVCRQFEQLRSGTPGARRFLSVWAPRLAFRL